MVPIYKQALKSLLWVDRGERPQGGAGRGPESGQEVKHAPGTISLGPIEIPRQKMGERDGQVNDLQAHSWGSCIWSNLRGPQT